jgi:iron complex outermembrane receptor protein
MDKLDRESRLDRGSRLNAFATAVLAICGAAAVETAASSAAASTAANLSDLSLEELANLEVTSVSKRSEPLSRAPSAVYVIHREEILRSGATTLPEILRLAPNLYVAQTSANHYVVTARGFSGSDAAQAYSNKLLVMIDGRTVYSPLFSGVYWDMQDVLPADIDRIEIVSGPGATLWGANAVNGVINIITLDASESTGFVGGVLAGDQDQVLGARYGRVVGDVAFRVYGRAYSSDATEAAADDAWSRIQGGFRADWRASDADLVSVHGDVFDGSDDQPANGQETFRGRNLTARWTHAFASGAEFQAQAYYDRAERATRGAGEFAVDTFNLDAQHSFALGSGHEVVVGGGLRSSDYRIASTPDFFFEPSSGVLKLANAFAQDTIALRPDLRLTVGLKVEDDPYVPAKLLPNARLAWTPRNGRLFWAAVSRAVRSPTPFERDVRERLDGVLFLIGDADYRHEKLTAYEAGARFEFGAQATLSVSGFYNVYDDLRSVEFTPVSLIPLRWDNQMHGDAYGFEAWAEYRLADGWRMWAGYAYLEKDLRFDAGSSGLLGVAQAGDDPKHRAMLRTAVDIGSRGAFDATLRYNSALPDPHVPAYVELDARLRWRLTDHTAFIVGGRNLLHDEHVEFSPGAALPRTGYVGLRWWF